MRKTYDYKKNSHNSKSFNRTKIWEHNSFHQVLHADLYSWEGQIKNKITFGLKTFMINYQQHIKTVIIVILAFYVCFSPWITLFPSGENYPSLVSYGLYLLFLIIYNIFLLSNTKQLS